MTHTHIEAIQRIARLQQGSTKYIQVYPSMITETIKFVPRDNWVCTISSGYLRIWLSLKAVLMWFSKNLENPWALMTISTWSIHYLVASSICFLLLFHPASIKRLLSRLRFIFARSSGNQSDMVFLHTCNGHIPILVGWSVLVCWSPRNNCRKPVTSGNSTKKKLQVSSSILHICQHFRMVFCFSSTFGFWEMIRGFVACYLIFDEPANSGWWFQTFVIVHFIFGMSSFPLTNSIIFQGG